MNPNNPNIYPTQPPQQPPQQPQPTPQPYMQPQAPIEPEKTSKRKKLALLLILGPTALFVGALLLFAVVNWVSSATTEPQAACTPTSAQTTQNTDGEKVSLFADNAAKDEDCSLFGETSPLQTAANIGLYIAGAISFLAWLPGLIIGIVLLVKKPKTTY